MKLRDVLSIAMVTSVMACGDATQTTGPAQKPTIDPWSGDWELSSVNGLTLPASTMILGFHETVYSRSLNVISGGTGTWSDSTMSELLCGPSGKPGQLCNASGHTAFTWSTVGDTLYFFRDETLTSGYVVTAKTFVKQANGTLLKTDDSQTEVYARH